MKNIDDGQHIDNLVAHHLANNSSTRTGLNSHRVTAAIATTALDTAAMQHGDTQYHALLQHQRQDEQQYGTGNTHCGVAHRHLVVLDDRSAHIHHGFDDGSHPFIAHCLSDVGQSSKHRLVAHHHAHVAVERHMRLFSAAGTLAEITGHVQDAITLLAMHGLLCLLHVGGIACNSDLLGSIETAHEVTARMGAVVIDNHNTLVAYHLGIIDNGIQDRVNRIEEEEKDDYALVTEHEQQLAAAHPQHLDAPQEKSAMFQFLGHIIRAHTRGSCTPSSSAMTAAWAGW